MGCDSVSNFLQQENISFMNVWTSSKEIFIKPLLQSLHKDNRKEEGILYSVQNCINNKYILNFLHKAADIQ